MRVFAQSERMPLDVKKIKRLDSVRYVFVGIAADPEKPIILDTLPCTFERREVVNGLFEGALADLADLKTKPDGAKSAGKIDRFDEAQRSRESDLRLVARLCVKSWENVTETIEVEEDGAKVKRTQAIECTPDNVLRVLRELDAIGYREEVSQYLKWATDPLSFRARIVEPEELKKG